MSIISKFRKHTLFRQILLAGLVPLLLMFFSLFSYTLVARLNDAAQSQREIGRRVAENIAALSELAIISGDQQQIRDILPSALTEDIVSITVSQLDSGRQWQVVNKQRQQEASETVFANIYQRSVAIEDAITGETMGKPEPRLLGSVAVEQSTRELRQLQQQILVVSSIIGILVAFLSVALAWLISRRLATPLAEINAATRDIANGRTGVRISQGQSGELGELQQHINDMSASLDEQQLAIKNHVSQLEIAKAEAEQANMAKSLFLATMTHELRTPMNGALGMLQMLAETELDQEQNRYVEIARDFSELLLGIVNDLLDFSRIEKGELHLVEQYFEVNGLIEKTVNALRHDADQKHIGLELALDPALRDTEILADETRLRQIILNLGSNAVKFTEQGRVRLSLNCLSRQNDEMEIELTVEDTGIGISASQQQIIFESFRQADSSTVRRYGGSGLGLAIVKRLCEMMAITLRLDSDLGRGTRFQLRWHCRFRQRAQRAAGVAKVAQTLVGKTALVVEDNAVNQMLVSNILQKWGMRVTTANHGGEALTQLAKAKADVVLMDLQMPVMDGFEACEKIRQNPTLNSVCIIALTANTLQEDRDRCLASGMNDYLSKPVSLPKLKEMLLYWLGRETGTTAVESVDSP